MLLLQKGSIIIAALSSLLYAILFELEYYKVLNPFLGEYYLSETINESPYDEGWLVEIEVADKSEIEGLLEANSYKKII